MSVMTRNHETKAGREGARRLRREAARAAPVATNMGATAKHGVYVARVWTAPRLERTGRALQERVGPKACAMLSATARRVDPVQHRRPRWPMIVAGTGILAGGVAAAVLLRARREQGSLPGGPPTADEPAQERGAATAETDGHVRTPS